GIRICIPASLKIYTFRSFVQCTDMTHHSCNCTLFHHAGNANTIIAVLRILFQNA
ncbi:hypothetical protein L9F63_019413, partial [Diploptera punctata]